MSKGKREAVRTKRPAAEHPFAAEGGKRGKKTSGGRIALITIACLAAAALVIAGAVKLFVVAPDVSDNDAPGGQHQEAADEYDPTSEDAPTAVNTDKTGETGRKENYFTFLLMGKDTSSGSTDTIILVSYDVTAGKVNCMSIPRDTMVNVSWDIKKINSVYSMEGGDEKGMAELKKHVASLTGITPDFHVIIEWKAVGRLVEALDGVWFDVPYTMDYDDPYQDLHIHQEKGYRLLDGDDAMQVVRWRGNNNDSPYGYHKEDGGIGDTGRMSVQQDFLKAVASQCLQLKNWNKISEFANIFFENVETDIKLNNLMWFAQQAMGVNMDNVSFMTVPGNEQGWAWSRTYRNNQSYFFAYGDEVVEVVNQHFNPYLRDITEDDLQIMYKNKNGSLGVTNGTLADSKAASAPVKPAAKPADEAESGSEGAEEEAPEGNGETSVPDSGLQGDVPSGGTGAAEGDSGELPVQPDTGTEAPAGSAPTDAPTGEEEQSGGQSFEQPSEQGSEDIPSWLMPG